MTIVIKAGLEPRKTATLAGIIAYTGAHIIVYTMPTKSATEYQSNLRCETNENGLQYEPQ